MPPIGLGIHFGNFEFGEPLPLSNQPDTVDFDPFSAIPQERDQPLLPVFIRPSFSRPNPLRHNSDGGYLLDRPVERQPRRGPIRSRSENDYVAPRPIVENYPSRPVLSHYHRGPHRIARTGFRRFSSPLEPESSSTTPLTPVDAISPSPFSPDSPVPPPSPALDSRVNPSNIAVLGVVLTLSVIVGIILIGVSGMVGVTCYKQRRRTKEQARIKEEMEVERRASFSCGGKPSSQPQEKAEWVRADPDSPNHGNKSKGRRVAFADPPQFLRAPPNRAILSTAPKHQRSHLPKSPSPLGSSPALLGSHISPPRSIIEPEGTPLHNTDPSSSSPLQTTLAYLNSSLLASSDPPLPTTTPIATQRCSPDSPSSPAVLPQESFQSENVESTAKAPHSRSSSISSIASVDSHGADSTNSTAETHITGESSIDHTATFTPAKYAAKLEITYQELMFDKRLPWDMHVETAALPQHVTKASVDERRDIPVVEQSLPEISTSDSAIGSGLTEWMNTSGSTASSNLDLAYKFRALDSQSSTQLLKNNPLPPPTIMVSVPTDASLRTRAHAAFQIGALLVDSWEHSDEDEGDDELTASSGSDVEWEWEWAERAIAASMQKSVCRPMSSSDASSRKDLTQGMDRPASRPRSASFPTRTSGHATKSHATSYHEPALTPIDARPAKRSSIPVLSRPSHPSSVKRTTSQTRRRVSVSLSRDMALEISTDEEDDLGAARLSQNSSRIRRNSLDEVRKGRLAYQAARYPSLIGVEDPQRLETIVDSD